MTNEQRAEQIINRYGFDFSKIPGEEIAALLRREIGDYHPGSSEYIRLLCGYLYCIGDAASIPLLEEAKYSINMDVGCMVDAEWIDSLKNGGVEEPNLRPRWEIIQSFISYYRDFEPDDLW
ncbi:hypothetical protein AALC17_06790 [Oscillospiraceae bacterium 38-13]